MRSLQNWQPWETTLPAGIDRDAVTAAIGAADRRLRSASPQQFAVTIDALIAFGRACGIHISDAAGLVKHYRAAVTLPPDLLAMAVERAIREWRWGNRLPLPAELSAFVADEMAERHADMRRLHAARRKALAQATEPVERDKPIDCMNTDRLPPALHQAYWDARLDGATPTEARERCEARMAATDGC